MQLWIQINNLEILQNIEDLLFADDKTLAQFFMKNLPGEVYENLSPQYEISVIANMQIKKTLGANAFKNIKGFYWGNAQCEFLMPTVDETKKAVELMKEFDKKYTSKDPKRLVFLTSYYGNPIIKKRMIENFEYLNENADYINKPFNDEKTQTKISGVEVVINDFGTLILVKNYPNLKPILGNLLIKTLKNPIVDTLGIEKNVNIPGALMKNASPERIAEYKKTISENQKKGIGRSALNNEYFLKFLKNNNINRGGIDYMQNFETLYEPEVCIDIYYPYALIYVGRLCDTSAISNIKRGYYPIDDVCPRTCMKYEISMQNFETVGYKIIQKGNAGYKSQTTLNLPASAVDRYDNRLVYMPLI